MLHGDVNATGAVNGHRQRVNTRTAAPEAAQNMDYIRKELRRLAKMARQMHKGELAHFIDVACQVASEAAAAEGKRA